MDYLELIGAGLLGWFIFSCHDTASKILALFEKQLTQHRNHAEELEKRVGSLRADLQMLASEIQTLVGIRIVPSLEEIEKKVEALDDHAGTATIHLKKIREDIADEIKLRWG